MSRFIVNIMYSDSISEELRLQIEEELIVEGVDVLSSTVSPATTKGPPLRHE
jgi:hypothetical protein